MELLNVHIPLRMLSKKNSKARGRYHGKPFLTPEVRNLQTAIAAYARKHRVESVPYGGTVAVEIIAHWSTRIHADTPNVPEIICDALQGSIYENDRQIGPLLVIPCECGKDAVTIRVRTTERQEGVCVRA